MKSNAIKKIRSYFGAMHRMQEQKVYFEYLEKMRKEYRPFFETEKVKTYFSQLRSLLTVKDVGSIGGVFVRIGKHHDGGYVMLDDFNGIDCAYSIGINDDVSWDADIKKRIGCDIFMYDHTISALPYTDTHFKWRKIGICGSDTKDKTDMLTLDEMIVKDGMSKNDKMIFKMDVEGAEWEALDSTESETLGRFDQIVMELHGLLDFNQMNIIVRVLEKLNLTHQLIQIHGSNGSFYIPYGDVNIPNVIEVCYVRKKGREFCHSERFFPTELDENNNGILPDVMMGFWN